jgi:hypothetical protein
MSAITPLATFERTCRDICLVPDADIGVIVSVKLIGNSLGF